MNRKVALIFNIVLLGLSAIAIGAYLYVALSRISYPFAVEWVETNTFAHIVRILEGKSVFVPPSYDFVPMLYTPFYYYITAVFAKATGQIMFSLRLVSLLSSLLTFAAIYVLCRLRYVTHPLSMLAVGLFAAAYAVTGYWLDVGRVDSLFVALILVGYVLAIARRGSETFIGIIAGIIMLLAYATKQSAALAVPFQLLYLLLERRWLKSFWLGVTFVVSWAIFVIAMNSTSDGWFWLYTYTIPSAHPISWGMVTHQFWTVYIFPNFSGLILIMILAVAILLLRKDRVGFWKHTIFAIAFLLPLAMMSVGSIAKQWGWANALLPLVAAMVVIGAAAYQELASAAHSAPNRQWLYTTCYYMASAAMLFQYGNLRYDPRAQIPTRASIEAGNKIIKQLSASEGPIFVPTAPNLSYAAHQQIHFQASSLGDITLAAQYDPTIHPIVDVYLNEIDAYLQSRSIKTIILPNTTWYDKIFSTKNGYACSSLTADAPPLSTLTGAISRLDRICHFSGSSPH